MVERRIGGGSIRHERARVAKVRAAPGAAGEPQDLAMSRRIWAIGAGATTGKSNHAGQVPSLREFQRARRRPDRAAKATCILGKYNYTDIVTYCRKNDGAMKIICYSAMMSLALATLSEAQVTSFNARTGTVTLQTNDVTSVLSNRSLQLGTGTLTAAGVTNTGNETVGGTLGVTGTATFNNIANPSSSTQLLFKNGPAGPIMLEMGGSLQDIEPQTDINLQGGAWSTGVLANNRAPIYQNATFSGSTTSATAGFGIFMQQSDNSSNTGNLDGAAAGIYESLTLNGSSVVGGRAGAQVNLTVAATTGNSTPQDYVGIGSKCNLNATDATTGSSCFGANPVSSIGQNVTARSIVGQEIDTWEQSGAIITDRIGQQIVDVMGSTYGVQAIRDDVGISLNNQYSPSTSLGFKVGLEFGRFGGLFPIATNGTLIYGQGNQGGTWTVANGIDWHLGTFTGNSWNDGHIQMTGAGDLLVNSAASLPLSAAVGFLSPPFTTGIPTGRPSLNTSCAIDTANAYLNCYFGGAWHKIAFAPGAG